MEDGSGLYLVSEGYKDPPGGTENKKIMETRFKELLLDNQHLSMDEQYNVLKSAFLFIILTTY